jgi:hypothetical protein
MLDLIVGRWSSHTGDDYGTEGRQDRPMSERLPTCNGSELRKSREEI